MKFSKILALLMVLIPVTLFSQTASWSEFMNGNRKSYSTDSNPKAKGVLVSFDYPSSWKGLDGKHPNTLYQVTSEDGKGLELCNLVIRDIPLPPGYVVTDEEMAELFDPASLSDFIPVGGNFISGKQTKIDGQLAAQIQFSQDMDRAGIQLKMIWVSYPVYYDKKLIIFSCGVGDGVDKPFDSVKNRYMANFPLFQQLANSIVIHSKWKQRP